MIPSRRDVLRVLGLAGAVGLTGCQALLGGAHPATDQNWPMFGFDARNSGAAPATTGPASGVSVEWQVETHGPIRGSPAVVDGTVYFATKYSNVYAVDAETGKEEWQTTVANNQNDIIQVTASPAVSDGTVFIGTENGGLFALDAASGAKRWRVKPSPNPEWSTPTVSNGTVYVGATNPTAVFALDADSGEEQWRFDDGLIVISSQHV